MFSQLRVAMSTMSDQKRKESQICPTCYEGLGVSKLDSSSDENKSNKNNSLAIKECFHPQRQNRCTSVHTNTYTPAVPVIRDFGFLTQPVMFLGTALEYYTF